MQYGLTGAETCALGGGRPVSRAEGSWAFAFAGKEEMLIAYHTA